MSGKTVPDMNKNELAVYAKKYLDVDLDQSKKLVDLRAEVLALVEALEDSKTRPAARPKKSVLDVAFLKHPVNGRVYVSTPHLVSRKDMIPCDKKGNTVSVETEEVPE